MKTPLRRWENPVKQDSFSILRIILQKNEENEGISK